MKLQKRKAKKKTCNLTVPSTGNRLQNIVAVHLLGAWRTRVSHVKTRSKSHLKKKGRFEKDSKSDKKIQTDLPKKNIHFHKTFSAFYLFTQRPPTRHFSLHTQPSHSTPLSARPPTPLSKHFCYTFRFNFSLFVCAKYCEVRTRWWASAALGFETDSP